jgi:NhaA family Na+:H+ antiporter
MRAVPGARVRRLLRPVDRRRDHPRGGAGQGNPATIVIYGDYLCPYCRKLRPVLARLHEAMGEKLAYVFRQFPNERIHPGANFLARAAEAAARQGRFWDMHDALYNTEPLTREVALELAASLGLDMARFRRDIEDPKIYARVQEDIDDGKRNTVAATPTIFVDGVLYDGAWDFYSLLEALERPVGVRVRRTARAFANLPTSAGLVLLIAALAAMLMANGSAADFYQNLVTARLGLAVSGASLTMSVAQWCSDALLTVFFLIVGLEIRRELTMGSLSEPKAAAAPLLAAIGGAVVPAALYLVLNHGSAAAGWATPIDTGLAFTLGLLAVFGPRVPASLKAFVATYAVAADVLVLAILAIFFPHNLKLVWLAASLAVLAALFTVNRWRVYAAWPYVGLAALLWITLHVGGLEAALTGILLAAVLPTRPAPAPTALLGQVATALAELEQAEREIEAHPGRRRIEQDPVWEWASRNLSAASDRLLSPAERVERSLAPWSTYVALPLFAFTAAGVSLAVDLNAPGAQRIVWGVVLGLALGKPLGIGLASWAGQATKVAVLPADATPLAFLGAAALCGIGDPLSILIADQAFGASDYAALAKVGVFIGSLAATALGMGLLFASGAPGTQVSQGGNPEVANAE